MDEWGNPIRNLPNVSSQSANLRCIPVDLDSDVDISTVADGLHISPRRRSPAKLANDHLRSPYVLQQESSDDEQRLIPPRGERNIRIDNRMIHYDCPDYMRQACI